VLLGLDVRVLDGLAPFGQIRLDAITRLLRCEVHGLVAFAFDRGDHGRIFHDLVDGGHECVHDIFWQFGRAHNAEPDRRIKSGEA